MVSDEFDVSISLDSPGFQKTIEFGRDNVREPLHITLLGDLFMFGWVVEYSQSFAMRLAQYLHSLLKQRVIVSSLEAPGTGQFTQFFLLKRILKPKPDIILAGST